MAKFIKARCQATAAGGPSPQAKGGRWEKSYPALLEFLTLTEWEPGQPRPTGSLSIFVDGGTWKCCLSNRDSGEIAFLASDDPEGLLESLEKHLVADTLDWRQQKGRGSSRGK